MIASLTHVRIGTRVISAFALVTLISALVILIVSADYYQALVARDQAVKISFDAQQTASTQQANLQRMNALLQTRYAQVFATISGSIADPSLEASGALINSDILTREDEFAQTLQTYQQTFAFSTSPSMQGVRAIVLSDDPHSPIRQTQQQALTTVTTAEWPGYKALQDQELRLLNTRTNPLLGTDPHLAYAQAYPILYHANQLFLVLKLDWQQVVDVAQTIGEVVTNVGMSQTRPIVQTTLGALLLTLLVIVVIGTIVTLTITRPLNALTALTRRIAANDLSARAPLWGRDEIHTVASSMNAMLDHMVALIEESEGQRARLQFQVKQLLSDVSGVGQGDLRARADIRLPDLGALAASFNFMITAFSALIRRIKDVAYEVASSTGQVSQSMSSLVTSAGHQIVQIREASAKMEHMAAESSHVAHKAAEMSVIALHARHAAQDGDIAVRQTITVLGTITSVMRDTAQHVQRLHSRSSAIDEISSIASTLAQRTQRLALDAAIQVSMAPVPNAGFATVVEEICSLSEQAKRESERIGALARAVVQDIIDVQKATHTTALDMERMTTIAAQTGTALEATFLAVQRQADEIQEMATIARAQVQSVQRVDQVMHQVSQATRQSSHVTEVVSYPVQRQAHLVLQLRTSVEAFRVHDEQNYAPGPGRSVVGSGRPS